MSLWQYKVYENIRARSLERGRQTTVGRSKTAIFSAFGRYNFGTFRDTVRLKLLYGNT